MTCDRAGDRTLLLSLGLFGAPAEQADRESEARAAEPSEQTAPGKESQRN